MPDITCFSLSKVEKNKFEQVYPPSCLAKTAKQQPQRQPKNVFPAVYHASFNMVCCHTNAKLRSRHPHPHMCLPKLGETYATTSSTRNVHSRGRGRPGCHPFHNSFAPHYSTIAQHSYLRRVVRARAKPAGGMPRCGRSSVRAPWGVGYFASRRVGAGRVQGGSQVSRRPSGSY